MVDRAVAVAMTFQARAKARPRGCTRKLLGRTSISRSCCQSGSAQAAIRRMMDENIVNMTARERHTVTRRQRQRVSVELTQMMVQSGNWCGWPTRHVKVVDTPRGESSPLRLCPLLKLSS